MNAALLRRYVLPAALLLAGVFLLFQLYAYWQYSRPVFDGQGRLLRLPDFEFRGFGPGDVCTHRNFHRGPAVVVYYGPDCAHCRKLGTEVALRQAELGHINWLFVTRAPVEEARSYAVATGLSRHQSVFMGLDENAAFYQYFGDMYIPSTYVFDSDRKFLQTLHQDTGVDDLLQVVAGNKVNRPKSAR